MRAHRIAGVWCGLGLCVCWLTIAGTARAEDDVPPASQEYVATAYLRLLATPQVVAPDDDAATPTFEVFTRTQVAMLTSPIVLDRVLADDKIAALFESSGVESPRRWIQERLSVDSVNNSELFAIRYRGLSAENAVAVANAVLDAYLKIQEDLEARQTQKIVDLLDKEMDRRARELERLRQSVRALVKMTADEIYLPSTAIGAQYGTPSGEFDPIVALRKVQVETEIERMRLEANLAAREAANLAAKPIEIPDGQVDADSRVHELRTMIAGKKGELAKLQNENKPERAEKFEPKFLKEVAELQEELAKRIETIRAQRSLQASRERAEELADLRLRLDEKNRLLKSVAERVDGKIKEREKGNNHALDLEFLRQDLARSEAIYEQIADRAEILKTNMRAPQRVGEMRRARVDDVEIVPAQPS